MYFINIHRDLGRDIYNVAKVTKTDNQGGNKGMFDHRYFNMEQKPQNIHGNTRLNWVEISNYILQTVYEIPKDHKDITVLCIGTDKSTGDSLGPLTGTLLKERFKSIEVIGTLDHPVHAQNLEKSISEIDKNNRLIIVIDAANGNPEETIRVKKGGIKPGEAVGRDFEEIGDISITGTVNRNFGVHNVNKLLLNTTRLKRVYTMAKCISQALHFVFYKLEKLSQSA